MIKLRQYARQSIGRRMFVLLFSYFLLFAVGAAGLLGVNYSTLIHYQSTMQEQQHKQETLDRIADHANLIIFRARGYYSFQSQYEYEEIFLEKERLEAALTEFSELKLSEKEKKVLSAVSKFYDNYFATVIPQTTAMVRNNDYEGLRNLSTSGVMETVYDLLNTTEQTKRDGALSLKDENKRLLRQSILQNASLLLYTVLLLLVAFWNIRRISRGIGQPLSALASNADLLAEGEPIRWEQTEREDEIGRLTRSFESMALQVRNKEDMLVAQNEELSAQQDELQMQQEELQKALQQMEENEKFLHVRNELTAALANTLDKRTLLDNIIEKTATITRSDKGIIFLLNRDRDYAAFGLSDELARRYLSGADDLLLPRLLQTKTPYVVSRAATGSEKGFHEEEGVLTDIHIPILSAADEVIAVMVLSRSGTTENKLEEQELTGLARQFALSLEKLGLHENTERQRQLTQNILNTIHEGVTLLDAKGTIILVNSQMRQLMDDDPSCAEGSTLDHYLDYLEDQVEEASSLRSFLLEAANGTLPPDASMFYSLSNLEKRIIMVYCEPVELNQEQMGVLLVHRDMTHEYEVDRMKSEFVSTVSHELRTPLASVLGFTELLLTRELRPERQRKYLTTIHEEAKRLTSLINDFLDLQRMESGRQSYEKKLVNLVPLLAQVVEMSGYNSNNHSLSFSKATSEAFVFGDKDKLKQVFLNLLSNAIKYSPQGGRVQVELKQEGKDWRIDVRDGGLGIPQDALPNLFTKFYRVDNSDRRQIGGTGLGLSIVKEIVKVHDGDIRVRSEYGQGSTFTVTLPACEEEYALFSPEVSVPGRLNSSGKILVVEDDRHLQEMLTEELLERGFDVRVSAGVEEALAHIARERPDAIVLDLMLEGGQDGWTIIERMKEDASHRTIPIFISSAFEEQDRANQLGAAGYLVKPYPPHQLSDSILQTLKESIGRGAILIPEKDLIKNES